MGERIKIKEMEGDSDALKKIFEDSDCSLAEYLNIPKKSKIYYWILFISFVLFVISLCFLWNMPKEYVVYRKILELISFIFIGCVAIFVHLCWKNFVVTSLSVLFAVFSFLIALDAISPERAAKEIGDRIEGMHKE